MMRLILALGLAVSASGCKRDDGHAARADRPRPVVTAPVERVEARQVGPFAGKIEARYRTSLGFRTAGRVIERDALVGQSVTAGTVLARLDPTQQRLDLARADADFANGEAQVTNATAEFDRKKALFDQGVDPQAVLDLARANRDAAVARLDALRATQRKSREVVDYTDLRAEFDGVVTAWQTEIGNHVQAGEAVVEMVRPEVREAVVDLPVDIVRDLPPDATFAVALEGAPAQTVPVHLRERGPLADAQTRSQRLRFSLDTTPDAFRLGSTILVTVQHAVAPHLRLPAASILQDGQDTAVWIVTDGRTAERRPVSITERRDDFVVATGDLPAAARVLVAGIHSLKPGQPVRLAKDR